MALLQAKQIDKVIAAPIFITGVDSGLGLYTTIDTPLAAALATAGNNGGSVPLQDSAGPFSSGLILSGAYNRVEVFDNATGDKLQSDTGEELYGRLDFQSGEYRIYMFTNEGGTETAFNMGAPDFARDLDFTVNYRFLFKDLPADAPYAVQGRYVSDDASGLRRMRTTEKLTIATQNTIPSLAVSVADTTDIKLIVNNRVHPIAAGAFSSDGSTGLTWNQATAGYNLEATDDVVAEYAVYQ